MPAAKKPDPAAGVAEDAESILSRLRSMEEFGALGQFLFIFGTDVLNLPDFGREELETELLAGHQSTLIDTIKMSLLKMVSSQRGLVPGQFDEYTRRQYRKRKPDTNPFGVDEEAAKFADMSVFDRAKVLHQLSVWAFTNPDRMRDKMTSADEKEQLTWRIEPCGFDRHGNTYYILDDNRLYRRTPWTIEPPPPKKRKQARKGTKRRRVAAAAQAEEEVDEIPVEHGGEWSCVCVTCEDWDAFAGGYEKSKHPDEKALYMYLKEDVLPELRKTWLEMEKQKLLEAAVANRKRSSRIDAKLTRQKEEEEKRAITKREAKAAEEAQRERLEFEQREKEREIRIKTREQRIKEREQRLLQPSGSRGGTSGDESPGSAIRRSSRRKEKQGKVAAKDEKEWLFDCICGANGVNYDDGTEIIACDSCDVWQHLACQKLSPGTVRKEEFEFICSLCKKYRASASFPPGPDGKPPSPQIIKLRVGPPSPVKTKPPAGPIFGNAAGASVLPENRNGHPHLPPVAPQASPDTNGLSIPPRLAIDQSSGASPGAAPEASENADTKDTHLYDMAKHDGPPPATVRPQPADQAAAL